MNQIDLLSPEELFEDPEMVALAKKWKRIPTVVETRRVLHSHTTAHDVVSQRDIERVNTPGRREKMRQKTNELRDFVSRYSVSDKPAVELMLDMYDVLAIDWVYSNQLVWEGSLADSYALKIKKHVAEVVS